MSSNWRLCCKPPRSADQAKARNKYLGLKLDSTLSGDSVVQDIVTKCNNRIKFLYRNNNCLDFNTRRTLALALIQCHFDYGASAWFMGLSKANQRKLQVAQNKLVRFILGLSTRSHVGYNEFKRANLLSVADRVKQRMLLHMFNVKHQVAPSYLSDLFSQPRHSYNTRRAEHNFFIPRPNSNVDSKNLTHIGPRIWNDLPSHIKQIPDRHLFKTKVKKFLFDNAHRAELDQFVYY
jgi:hypothetical protein